MTDRELLELAAKASGYELVWGEKYNIGSDVVDCTDMSYIRSEDSDVGDVYWNPLTDDGDALRMAVKLNIHIIPKESFDEEYTAVTYTTDRRRSLTEPLIGDFYSATRRAIVRAAAEIGKAMP